MLAKAFGVARYLLWSPFTFLIRAYFLDHAYSCPDCGSEDVVNDGYNERENMPDMPMLECNDCGEISASEREQSSTGNMPQWGNCLSRLGFSSGKVAETGFGNGSAIWENTALKNGSTASKKR